MIKTCTKCNKRKSTDLFRPGKRYSDGYRTQCKQCEAEYGKQYRARVRDQPKTTVIRKLCTKCATDKPCEEFRISLTASDGRCSWCISCSRVYNREWDRSRRHSDPVYAQRVRDATKERARRRALTEYGREQKRRTNKKYSHSEGWREKRRAYYYQYEREGNRLLAKRENNRLTSARYRAKKIQATTTGLNAKQWYGIVCAYGNCCAYCGRLCDLLEQEHVIPLARGGKHEATNIVPACRSCNAIKGNRTPEEAGMRITSKT